MMGIASWEVGRPCKSDVDEDLGDRRTQWVLITGTGIGPGVLGDVGALLLIRSSPCALVRAIGSGASALPFDVSLDGRRLTPQRPAQCGLARLRRGQRNVDVPPQ